MRFRSLIAAALFVLAVSTVQAQSITNGSFDTDLSGWAHNTDTLWFGDPGPDGHVGVAFVGNTDPLATGFLNQTITGLGVGNTYEITGYYENYGGFAGSHSLTAQIDNVTQFSNSDLSYVLNWKPFTFDFIATGPTADLQINSQVGSDTNYLVDQISIRQVTPEPGTVSLLVGLAVAATVVPLNRRKRK